METSIWLKCSHYGTGKGKILSVMAAGSPREGSATVLGPGEGSATVLGPGEGCSVSAEQGKAVPRGPGSAEPQT